jgi:hypothetical protein
MITQYGGFEMHRVCPAFICFAFICFAYISTIPPGPLQWFVPLSSAAETNESDLNGQQFQRRISECEILTQRSKESDVTVSLGSCHHLEKRELAKLYWPSEPQ